MNKTKTLSALSLIAALIITSKAAPGDRQDVVPISMSVTQPGKYKLAWKPSGYGIYTVQFTRRIGEGWRDLATVYHKSGTNEISFIGNISGQRMFFRVVK